MAEITASLVKELREKTGAGMMDCKKALGETDGDIEEAIDWLRKKGLSAAAKKAGRVAAEGLVGVYASGNVGALIEVNSETDFVARNEIFQGFVSSLASLVAANGDDMEALASLPCPGSERNVGDELTHLIATIGENMTLRRAVRMEVDGGVVASYVHNAAADGLGRIGVLVGLKSDADADKLQVLGRQLAMHVAAAKPQSLSRDDLGADVIERERNIFADQARASGKPEEIIEKMVEGRLRKFYEEAVLLEQTFVIDNESKISKVLEDGAKDLGAPVEITGFNLYVLGEGIERKEEDFAAEVSAAAGTA